jgi:hypothetical protein
MRAVGTLHIRAAELDSAFVFQASYVDATRQGFHTQPRTLSLRPQGPVAVGAGLVVPPVGPQPPAGNPPGVLRPIKRLPPPSYSVSVPQGEKEEVPLPGPVADVTVGGGGRYLVLRLSGARKLAIFDLQQGKVARYLPLPEEPVHIAAGANRLVVIYPNSRRIQLVNLATLRRERTAPLPGPLTTDSIHQVCMGSASAGPLFVYLPKEKRTLAVDLDTLETAEVNWKHWAPNNAYGPLNMQASPDGSWLIGWGGGWAGCEVATFRDGQQTGSHDKIEYWGVGTTFALPSADGRFLFTPWGILGRDFTPAKVPELKGVYVVPAVEPGCFLALANNCTPGQQSPNAEPNGALAVYSEDRKPLFSLRDLDELKARSELAWEKRIHYYPRGGLLVTLGAANDRLVLRRVDLAEQLEKAGGDYLVVVSRPPAAKAGEAFSYKLDVRSKKGGVKVKLESGPPGLAVTPEGQVTWAVPAKPENPEPEVLVTVSDSSGQETFHGFRIEVAER